MLVPKIFNFVKTVWSQYVQHNLTDLRYVLLNLLRIIVIINTVLFRMVDETEPMSVDCDEDDDDDDGLQRDGEGLDENEWSDEECEGV